MEIQVSTGDLVNVTISSTLTSFASERRFQRSLTIADLKGKLELVTGAQAGSMQLEVYSKSDILLCSLEPNDALLGSFPVDDGCRIHVIDKLGVSGQFEDLSKVTKYEMASEDYEKRSDSVRAFKERNKMGRFNQELVKQKEEQIKKKEEDEKNAISTMTVGDRCEVKAPGNATRRGEVKYTGKTEFAEGLWVGVQYDEPLGKNDGSVKGKRYFTCPPKYGGFVSPLHVTAGDFPEEDFGMDDDEM